MNKSVEWNHIDTWRIRRPLFCVEVMHYRVWKEPIPGLTFDNDGGHRWDVYAYIYQGHPLFEKLDTTELRHEVCRMMPLHGGASYHKWHLNDNGQKVISKQVGSDYNHYGDERFSQFSTQEEASEVFADAADLIQYLEEKS